MTTKGWTFAYIGANQDSRAVSRSIGIKNSLDFCATEAGTRQMSEKLAKSRAKWFCRLSKDEPNANLSEDFFKD